MARKSHTSSRLSATSAALRGSGFTLAFFTPQYTNLSQHIGLCGCEFLLDAQRKTELADCAIRFDQGVTTCQIQTAFKPTRLACARWCRKF